MTDEQKTVDLVLEGGGVKGTALLGAVLTLYDAGYRFERIAGTSAGAIMASLIAGYQKAGRNLHELEEVAASLDYRKFQQDSPQKRMSRIGRMTNLALRDGEHSGQYLIDWLGPVLEGVGVTTFADLRVDDPDSSLPPDRSYALVVHTSDISRGAMVRLPWDYHEYGHQADQQLVVDAVRASMSVPFFFEPVTVPTDSGEVTWVDGSLLSNFPITCFDRTDGKPSRWPNLGHQTVQHSGQDARRADQVGHRHGREVAAHHAGRMEHLRAGGRGREPEDDLRRHNRCEHAGLQHLHRDSAAFGHQWTVGRREVPQAVAVQLISRGPAPRRDRPRLSRRDLPLSPTLPPSRLPRSPRTTFPCDPGDSRALQVNR